MISLTLWKQIMKENLKCFLLFTFILCVFLIVMCAVFTPDMIKDLKLIGKETVLHHIFGSNGTLISFMENSFYALMAILFPMVYSIMVGNRLIAQKIDQGSMVCFLSTPTSRMQITITSALYFITSLMFMWGIASVIGYLGVHFFQENAWDLSTFLMMNVGCFLYHFVISSICFCASCFFNTTKHSLMFGAGISIAFFAISLFIKVSDDLKFLKYFTLNTLFDTQKVIENSGYMNSYIYMIAIGICFYVIGIITFQRKDLPL